jgi:hypothetical protein
MPSTDELNAGFDVAHTKINQMIQTMLPEHIAFFNVRQMATDKFNSPEGRAALLDEVRSVLTAAEGVRAKTSPP